MVMQTAAEQIKDRLPITDVLSSYITLIPAGKQYKSKCPFHNERTASLSISPDKGLYYCFGCGARGDIFTFVQQFEGVDFNGSLKILAERAGVELKYQDSRVDDSSPIYEFLEKTTQRYQNELQKNKEALLYLKGRGLSVEMISEFRLGYAPDEWRFISNNCADDKERNIAKRAGLIKQKEENPDIKEKSPSTSSSSNYYDRFRGRIMFPLMDTSSRVIGFSGRVFPETPEGPKYLNSPETEVFHKSRLLYGFDKAKFHIKKHDFAILVEGQMDLLMSHQYGFKNTVATSGTALSEQSSEDEYANLVTLSRLTPHLFLAFDGDLAGQKALSRAALVALSLGMNPKVVPVPEGIDPAEFILKEGAEKWKANLQASQHFIVHQARAVKDAKHSPHMLVRALRESIFPFLIRVPSPIEQNLYTESVARELGLDPVEVGKELARFVTSAPKEHVVKEEKNIDISSLEEMTLKERFVAFRKHFSGEAVDALNKELLGLSFGEFIFDLEDLPEDREARALAIVERDYGGLTDQERDSVAQELATKVKEQFFAMVRSKLSAELREAEAKGEEEKMTQLLTDLTILNKRWHHSP